MVTKKYRPSLTKTQIEQIIALCKVDGSTHSLDVLRALAPFYAKIQHSAIKEAHTVQPKQSVYELLGMDTPQATVTSTQETNTASEIKEATADTIDINDYVTNADYWLACYTKYEADKVSCTVQEIEAAKEHMYLNDLMTPEQEEEWEIQHNV